MVNSYRSLAGVPPVGEDSTLNDNCWQHARYMAENNHLTHNQDSAKPYASPAGQECAGNGNAWLGSTFSSPVWEPADSIDSWMGSIGHRLWLIYPTTSTFGYGFYTAANNRAGAALDVLSEANFSGDPSYAGWPVKYPAPNQVNVPSTRYPITVYWRYFGSQPVLNSTGLSVDGGDPVAHTAGTTSAYANHKGIHLTPTAALPDNTVFVVTVAGAYNGIPFSYTWKFSTGSAPIP
jgi:hypothetical protein